jgi:hypothetical protein
MKTFLGFSAVIALFCILLGVTIVKTRYLRTHKNEKQQVLPSITFEGGDSNSSQSILNLQQPLIISEYQILLVHPEGSFVAGRHLSKPGTGEIACETKGLKFRCQNYKGQRTNWLEIQ